MSQYIQVSVNVDTSKVDELIEMWKVKMNEAREPILIRENFNFEYKSKCIHCGQWGEIQSECKYCGAPIS